MKKLFNKEGRNEGILKGESRAAWPSALLFKFLFLQFLLSSFIISAPAITPFYVTNLTANGLPITNELTFQVWPPVNNFSVNNGQVIDGSAIKYIPNSAGYLSNTIYAGNYRVTRTNSTMAQYYAIPDTGTPVNLASYITNASILNAAGYGALRGSSSDTAIEYFIDALRHAGSITFHTNTSGGITTLTISNAVLTSAQMLAFLGYTPPTNSYASLTNSLGFVPATNTLAALLAAFGYTPPTNSYPSLTNSLSFVPATNTQAALAATIGGFPETNNDTRAITHVGSFTLSNPNAGFTNGQTIWRSKTNFVPTWDNNYVQFATTTNDPFALYRLTNAATVNGTNWQKVF